MPRGFAHLLLICICALCSSEPIGLAGNVSEEPVPACPAPKLEQAEWRTVGPAPKDVADDVWNRFRAACDKIYGKARAADSAPAATANEPAPQGYSAPKLGDLLKK